jgi:hypothetical protein
MRCKNRQAKGFGFKKAINQLAKINQAGSNPWLSVIGCCGGIYRRYANNKEKGHRMKIKYKERKFRKKTLEKIEQANEIIEEYEQEDLTLTLRQLYYQFVARGFIPNTQNEYDNLGIVISDARLAGLISWDAIEDRTRNLQANADWKDPGEIVYAAADSFHMDRWVDQRYRPEVWVEKEALVGVIDNICNELDVDYFACRGYVSQSEMWNAGQRFLRYTQQDQVPVIIHLGDHDPSGIDMTRDIVDRLKVFAYGNVTLERIALNMDQVQQYNPPPNPAKLTDTRCNSYISKYGSHCWELDALEPKTLRNLVKDAVLKNLDKPKFDAIAEQEEAHRNVLRMVSNNWETLQ